MATPSTQISAADVNNENQYTSTQQMTFNDVAVRGLAGIPALGTEISMNVLRNKTSSRNLHYTSPKQNANLINDFPGVPTSSEWIVYIDAGVIISSTSTSIAAMTINGSFPGGLTLINRGYIVGRGGAGGTGSSTGQNPAPPGNAGGTALSVSSAVSIDNTSGVIGGGGGGGGGGGTYYGLGGGGGGGGGYGTGGGVGTNTNPQPFQGTASPGSPGTLTAGGAGGAGMPSANAQGSTGGAGGPLGTAGSKGLQTIGPSPGQVGGLGGNGGAAGAAVSGAPYITWINVGTRYGAIA